MEKVEIADTGIEVARIGLGTWAIGGWMWGGTDEDQAVRTIQSALDRGLDLIDTAPIYGHGRSEEIVGRALEETGRRDEVTIATKVGLEWNGEDVRRNSSRERLLREIDDSLERLRTDRIDVWQVHWPDADTPFQETAATMRELLEEGRIRAVGVSNYSPEQMDAFREEAPLHVCQPPYNLFERRAAVDVLPYCRRHGITTLTYGALCRGLLSGGISADTEFEGDDLRNEDPKFQPPLLQQHLDAVDELDRFAADRHGVEVIHLAVRWLLDQPGVDVALWGARRPEQLEPVDGVMGWSLDEDDLQAIDDILDSHVDEPVGPEFMAPPG